MPVRRIVVCANVSLDGVMQAPARADEDLRNGFEYGGWAAPYAAMAQAGHVFANVDALLLGRRTYEDFYSVWPKRTESPFTPWLNGIRKYVASRTLADPLPWVNSVLLKRSEEHTSELQSQSNLVCRLLLEKTNRQSMQHMA